MNCPKVRQVFIILITHAVRKHDAWQVASGVSKKQQIKPGTQMAPPAQCGRQGIRVCKINTDPLCSEL
jgi:hypothetical protein